MDKPSLLHVRSLMFGRPLCITETKFNDLVRAVGDRLGVEAPTPKVQSAVIESRPTREGMPQSTRLGVVPVHGTLVNRGAWMGAESGLTSYDGTRRFIGIYNDDPSIDAVVFDFDSPGGDAAGCADLANDIAAIDKPTYALVNAECNSAAYWLASHCDKIYITRDALVGSVGAVAAHLDQSRRDEQQGDHWTLVTSGRLKAQFSSHSPLSEEANAFLQNMITDVADRFIQAVATQRGLSVATVRDWQAAIFKAPDALQAGLIDVIAPASQAFALISEEVSTMTQTKTTTIGKAAASSQTTVLPQASETTPAATPESTAAENPATTPQASADPAQNPDIQALLDKAKAEAKAEAREEQRQRAAAIQHACDGMNRPELAAGLINSELSVDQAVAQVFQQEVADNSQEIYTGHASTTGGSQSAEVNAVAARILNAGKRAKE